MKDALRIRQNELNAQAVLQHYQLPPIELLDGLLDRSLWVITDQFREAFKELVPGHYSIWRYNKNHSWQKLCAAYRDIYGRDPEWKDYPNMRPIYGYRENVATCSMQFIEYVSISDSGQPNVGEFDADRFNPDRGLGPALFHLGEVVMPGMTDPFKIRLGLWRRGLEVRDARET